MYDKFQNDKTKNLDFTDIYKLVEPIKKLEEGEWLPDIYFIGKTLKEYSDLPNNYHIKAIIEHAAQLSDYVEGGFRIHESLPSIVPSPFRVSVIENTPGNNGAYGVGPYIAYAKPALSPEKFKAEKERLGRNLLVFPAHSIRGLNSVYDINNFCDEIKEIANSYDSVRICLYWKDILLGTAEHYKKHGFEVVTAGHYYDPMFMPRLKSIIETSTMTMSNQLGTHIGYCIYLKKPHYLIPSEIDIEMNHADGNELAKIEYQNSSKVLKKLKDGDNLIEDLLSAKEEKIKKDQFNIVNKYWGFDEIKSPQELRQLLLSLEGEYQLKFECEKELKRQKRAYSHLKRAYNHEITIRDDKIKKIMDSNSWKVTKPLRGLIHSLSKLK